MTATIETCDNCGARGVDLADCRSVWTEPHTHPRGPYPDLTPEPCRLMLCPKCARRVSRNLADQRQRAGRDANREASAEWAVAVFADADLRERMDQAIARTEAADPVPDDPEWIKAALLRERDSGSREADDD